MATLQILTGPTAGQVVDLTVGEMQLGRDKFCEVVIPVRSISRQHARLVCEGTACHIEDLNSLNGTFVNGQRITRRTRLTDQDRIRLFDVVLQFHEGLVPTDSISLGQTVAAVKVPLVEDPAPSNRSTTIVGAIDATKSPRVDVGAQAKLRAVLDITRNLGKSLEVDEFLRDILNTLFTTFPQASRGYILLSENGRLVPRAVRREGEASDSLTLGPISQSIAHRVMSEGKAILSRDSWGGDGDREASVLEGPVSSMISAPGCWGRRTSRWESFISIRRTRCTNSPKKIWKCSSASEPWRAKRWNTPGLTPTASYSIAGNGNWRWPSRCNCIFFRSTRPICRAISSTASIARRRMLAAIISAMSRCPTDGWRSRWATCRAREFRPRCSWRGLCSEVRFCMVTSKSPVEAMSRLNREFAGPTLGDMFITFLLGILDPVQHTLTLSNAGHIPPLLRRAKTGAVQQLGVLEAGPPLGYDAEQAYTTITVELEPNDIVVMYTDGISEASNPQGTFFGIKGVYNLVAGPAKDVESLGNRLLDHVEQFMGGDRQSDDICLVCFARE